MLVISAKAMEVFWSFFFVILKTVCVRYVLQVFCSWRETVKTPSQRTLLPNPPKIDIVLNVFRVLSKGPFLLTCLNYSSRFPEGIPKKEIQQWRQARSWPAEKETLNIYWGRKNERADKEQVSDDQEACASTSWMAPTSLARAIIVN